MGKELIDLTENDYEIYDKVQELLRFFRKETNFLEFKSEFQNSNGEFVKDVLALANTYTEYDRYIVYGIKDIGEKVVNENEVGDYIIGVSADVNEEDITQILDSANVNKTLSQYVHLKKVKTNIIKAGKVKEIRLMILHIANVPLKPFFLTKNYKSICSSRNEVTVIKETIQVLKKLGNCDDLCKQLEKVKRKISGSIKCETKNEVNIIAILKNAIATLEQKNKQFGRGIPRGTTRRSFDGVKHRLTKILDTFARNYYKYTYTDNFGVSAQLLSKGKMVVSERTIPIARLVDKECFSGSAGGIQVDFMNYPISDNQCYLRIYAKFIHMFEDDNNRRKLTEKLKQTLWSLRDIEMERRLVEYTQVTELIKKLKTALSTLQAAQTNGDKVNIAGAKQAMISRLRELEEQLSIKTLQANVIYTRHGATTAFADDDEIELMYRERFGIDKNPRDKAFEYLRNPDDWIYDETNGFIYCLNDPKYKIKRREKTNFEISEEARTYIKFRSETQQMRPESYYIEYEGCDINMRINVIIISNTTVMPNIYCRGDERADLETPCTDENLRALFVGGIEKFCEIIQNYYNRKNKTSIHLEETLAFYNAKTTGSFDTGPYKDADCCGHEILADFLIGDRDASIMNMKTYDHDSKKEILQTILKKCRDFVVVIKRWVTH